MISIKWPYSSDAIGVFAGGLCLIHCVATPFIFLAKACTTAACCADTPVWWQAIDYLFIVISFAAIYYATKHTYRRWVRVALWSSWTILVFTILTETLETGWLPESFIYFPALAIIGLHFYNLRFCRCADDDCIVNNNPQPEN